MDFRAPPPSPVASARRFSHQNDDVFGHLLETSFRVPNLNLANKHQQRPPPKVDFLTLCSDDSLRQVVLDSFATVGCFQLLNHGIPPDFISSPTEAAVGVFRVQPEKRAAVTRSPENPCGFDAEESELSEEFVWVRNNDFNQKMEQIWPTGYSNFRKKMDTLMSRIEKVAEKILPMIFKDSPKNIANSIDMIRGHELGTLCCVYKHAGPDNMSGPWANSLKYDVIRMLIGGTDYSHSLCLHVCDGSSEFHVYSKKGWLSFFPEKGALVITVGDQTQISSDGHYKHVIGRPIFKGEKEDRISMAFHYSPPNNKNTFQTSRERTISVGFQAILALILTILYHVLIYIIRKF
ncbi:hypothetical protein VNO77_29272 [Canavalia gladiata]|uniref:Uncharacterized protein n=1 Tax=Canavalia gladiata TaxID=3824 RepID=A0AAN9KWY6_CANGL